MAPPSLPIPVPDLALSLALAVVAASTAPLVLLDSEMNVIAASASFCHAFDLDASVVPGRQIYALGRGEWNLPRLRTVLDIAVSGEDVTSYELDLSRPDHSTRRLVLNVHLLDYADAANKRVLLSVADVTAARAAERLKDDLLRDKALLLQEVQHRVANSLQIIASVLMYSARKVPSDEIRSHLTDAHNRVMSIAAVQKQLAVAGLADVGLRVYLTQLCQSLAGSMIRDHDQLSIRVTADGSTVDPDVSVSLGLIVTELVINALKHAFPDDRTGKIEVDYRSTGLDWALTVCDNGIGMPRDPADAKPGLGTSIVQALARQLQAQIIVADANPGTDVSVVHIAAEVALLAEPAPAV